MKPLYQVAKEIKQHLTAEQIIISSRTESVLNILMWMKDASSSYGLNYGEHYIAEFLDLTGHWNSSDAISFKNELEQISYSTRQGLRL